jgi:hypothetical protein
MYTFTLQHGLLNKNLHKGSTAIRWSFFWLKQKWSQWRMPCWIVVDTVKP